MKKICSVIFLLSTVSFAFAEPAENLPPLEEPVRIILNYHGNMITPRPFALKNTKETVSYLQAQVEKEDSRRPVIFWVENGVPHKYEYTFLAPDYFVSELARETGMTPNQAIWAVLRPKSTPPAYVQTFNQALQIKYQRSEEVQESYLISEKTPKDIFLEGLIDWYQAQKKVRPMKLKIEVPPYESWLWNLRYGLWTVLARRDLLAGQVEMALKEQFFALASESVSILSRDKKLAEDVAYEQGFSPSAMQLVSRGAAHESFEKHLTKLGIRCRSIFQYDLRNDPSIRFINHDFSKAAMYDSGYLMTEEERTEAGRALLSGMAKEYVVLKYFGALAFLTNELDRVISGLREDEIREWIVRVEQQPNKSTLPQTSWEWLEEKPNQLQKILENCSSSGLVSDVQIPFGGETWESENRQTGFGESEVQYFPEGESSDHWTQKLTVHFFLGVTDLKNALVKVEKIKREVSSACQNYGWKEIQSTSNDAVYQWTVWNCEGVSNRAELLRIAVTGAGCYLLRYTYAAEKIPDEKYDRWITALNSVKFPEIEG